jgi:hypothetical protein
MSTSACVPCQSASLIVQRPRVTNTAQYSNRTYIAGCLPEVVHLSALYDAAYVLDLLNAHQHFTGMLSLQPMACIDRQRYNAALDGVALEAGHAVLYKPEVPSLPYPLPPATSFC